MSDIGTRVYEMRCPLCDMQVGTGYSDVAWYEFQCVRARCRTLLHYGNLPPHTPARQGTVEIRCPHCNRKYAHGQFGQGSWWEIQCPRCHQFYHYGGLGKGPEAVVREFCVNSLAPVLRGPHVRMTAALVHLGGKP